MEIETMESKLDIKTKNKSMLFEVARRFRKNKIAMLGLIIFTVIVLTAIFADLIIPYQTALATNVAEKSLPPNAAHWFGTDNYGRDIFARVVHASRISLAIGLFGVVTGVLAGALLGSISGYYGGKVDSIIMRCTDTLMCIPFMLLILAIVAALGANLMNIVIALVAVMIPVYTRIVRSAILTVVDMDYIEAARACGSKDRDIIFYHVLPNAIGPIIVQATMTVGNMIILAAAASFLGLGIQPPTPEWGYMLSEAKKYILQSPYMLFFPGIAIALTAFSLNLVGDGLRDALDPKLRD